MHKLLYSFQILAYYLAWISGMELAAQGFYWQACFIILVISGIQIFCQYKVMGQIKGLLPLIFILTFFGTVIDTSFLQLKLIHFAANPFNPYFSPPWMLALWFNFSILFFTVLDRFFHLYLMVGILSFIGFPLSYLGGVKLGAAQFLGGNLNSLYIGLVWAFLFPLCLYFYNRWMKKNA